MTIYRPRRHRRPARVIGWLALVGCVTFGGAMFWAGVTLWARGHIVQALIAGGVSAFACLCAVMAWNVLLFPRWPQ